MITADSLRRSADPKFELYEAGLVLINRWCAVNGVTPPEIDAQWKGAPEFSVCAYYRDSVIHIWPNACAVPGRAGRAWSWPGYTVDRTPYGVLAHELAHHVDRAHGARGGKIGHALRAETQAEPISGYHDNDNEWFAEMFRVFVTNPDLLRVLRPTVYGQLIAVWHRVEHRNWRDVLKGADRQIAVAEKRIPQPKGGLLG